MREENAAYFLHSGTRFAILAFGKKYYRTDILRTFFYSWKRTYFENRFEIVNEFSIF